MIIIIFVQVTVLRPLRATCVVTYTANYWIAAANENGRRRYDKHEQGQQHFVNKRLLRLHRKAGDVHRSRVVRHNICRRHDRQRDVGVDICPEQADEERTQYLHNQSGAR